MCDSIGRTNEGPPWRLAWLAIVAVAGLWVFATRTWPELPERFPIHFDGAGRPDGWATRDSPVWFLVPAAAVVVCGLSVGMGLLMHRIPFRYMNFPHKERLLAHPEAQAAVRASLARMLLWMVVIEAALFWFLAWQMAEVARGRSQRLDLVPMFAIIGALVVVPIAWTFRVMRAVSALPAPPPGAPGPPPG